MNNNKLALLSFITNDKEELEKCSDLVAKIKFI